jgi:hypothetical protein
LKRTAPASDTERVSTDPPFKEIIMRNTWTGWLALTVVVLGCSSDKSAPPAAPLAGNWKATVITDGKEVAFVLVKIEDKDGKPAMSVLGPEPIKDVPLENVAVEAGSVRFTLRVRGTPLRMAAYAPKGEENPKKLIGSVHPPGDVEPLILERTTQTGFPEKQAVKDSPGFDKLRRLRDAEDVKARENGLKELMKKHAGEPAALAAAEALVETAVAYGAGADKLRPLVEEYLKAAAVYGREMELHTAFKVARGLLSEGKDAGLALEFAQKAEKHLTAEDPLEDRAVVLKLLAQTLDKAGKEDEAKKIKGQIAKLDDRLDEEFEKRAIPFKPERPARHPKARHVVLVELFTGAQCPPCVAADIAFDAVGKTYKTGEVALLQYHLHIPGPDPLTNADSEARQNYYGKAIEGTPTVFLDGKPSEPLGGGPDGGKDSYDTLRKGLDEVLQKNGQAGITLNVRRTGDKVDLEAEVTELTKVGDRVRLRFALVEEVVRYPGRNQQRLHHHVVRAFPGGVEGFALLETTAKKKVSFSITELKKTLGDYLDKSAKQQPFLDDERPLNLKNLKVVAFIQDDKSKEVYQAIQMDVPEAE